MTANTARIREDIAALSAILPSAGCSVEGAASITALNETIVANASRSALAEIGRTQHGDKRDAAERAIEWINVILWIDKVGSVHAMGKDIPGNQYVTILTTLFRRAKFA